MKTKSNVYSEKWESFKNTISNSDYILDNDRLEKNSTDEMDRSDPQEIIIETEARAKLMLEKKWRDCLMWVNKTTNLNLKF